MRCFETAVEEITGLKVPNFTGETWASQAQSFLKRNGFSIKFIEIDKPAIISNRLSNGKVHAEVMHPTLITIVEKL